MEEENFLNEEDMFDEEDVIDEEYAELTNDENVNGNYISKSFYILSIICAILGILTILSYPLIHIIKVFYNIDEFMQKLPIGYLTTVKIPDFDFIEPMVMIVFGILCVIFSIRLAKWLNAGFSITSRITCFISGTLFMFFMISKEANTIFMQGVEFISLIVLFIVFLPVFETIIFFIPPFTKYIPDPVSFGKRYYKNLLDFLLKEGSKFIKS